MFTKEPFFDDDINNKSKYALSAGALKIPPSVNHPLSIMASPGLAPKSVRRPSREPYYNSSGKSSRSNSSSHARLSDIFDLGYFDQLRLESSGDVCAVFDSDSEYESDAGIAVFAGGQKWATPENTGGLNTFAAISDVQSLKNSEKADTDSESESELEEYKVHMLTFKVTSKAQYTAPPRTSQWVASDYFDKPMTEKYPELMQTSSHPKFTAPSMKKNGPDSSMFFSLQDETEGYMRLCAGSLVDLKSERRVPVAKYARCLVNDAYISHHQTPKVRDDFDKNYPPFLI